MPVERRGWVTHGVCWVNGRPEELSCLAGRRQPSLSGTSRMRRESHVRICERLGVRFPGPTRRRWRSNLWTYPGASSLGSDARRGLKDHPTVKPTAMLEDAILDVTKRDDIVLDPFLGSGSTLIAADKTSRVCRGVELDPLYVDVIVRRYQTA